jgi:N-acetylglucosaminyl-diphospho-decaprenol L-rhamnosyltransferase
VSANPRQAAQASTTSLLLIIIVNYRTGHLVVDCLQSLFAGSAMPEGANVIVADSASGDGSLDVIAHAIERQWENRIILVGLPRNDGFSTANNWALDHAIDRFGRPKYVLFLNPDTVARPGSIQPLIDFLEARPDAGIVGARLEDPDGTAQACAFQFPSILGELESEAKFGPISRLLRRWRVAEPSRDDAHRVDWISGAAMMVKIELIDELGAFDPSFFLYYEEVDLCLRAAKAGWSCWHLPQSRIVHLVGCSTGVTKRDQPVRRPAYWFASRRYYFTKHYGALYALFADLSWICGHLVWRFRVLLEGRRNGGPPHLLQDFIAHRLIGYKSSSKKLAS